MRDLVIGTHDFKNKRLNILQIGLGTFSTFPENLTDPSAASPVLRDLLESSHNSSTALLGVGVEPVSKHVDRLRPCIKHLPNTTLVQASLGDENPNEEVPLFELDEEHHKEALSELDPLRKKECEDRLLYLKNMSCVGQENPGFEGNQAYIAKHFGVSVRLRQVRARSFSYNALSSYLRFSGADVLMIDAEGHDCQILSSMIKHCLAEGNGAAWPDIIQFETMRHNDCKDGKGAEKSMLERFVEHGYFVACLGNDAQLVRGAALEEAPNVQRWLDSLSCGMCTNVGKLGVPFRWESDHRCYICWRCHSLCQNFVFVSGMEPASHVMRRFAHLPPTGYLYGG